MNKIIKSESAPKAIGPYSQAILAGNTLYVSGQLPIDSKTGEVILDVSKATTLCLTHIASILKEAGFEKKDIVKCTVLLTDLSNFSIMNEAYQNFFQEIKPARIAFEVSRLPKDVSVEIDCIAVKK